MGAPDCPVILHVPHAATRIPPDARESILLTDAELAVELGHMTDAHTDVLAAAAAREAGGRPWQFVNRCSRLVVDPERFPDDREEMLDVGMGAVYSATSHRTTLRGPDPDRDRLLIATYFDPYAQALTELVDQRLADCGSAVIIDVHSYPAVALPYERHAELPRPPICLGVDDLHTPDWLIDAARDALSAIGECRVDEPFQGTYVPLPHFRNDERVASIMIEIRRDVYCSEDGALAPTWPKLASALGAFARAAAGRRTSESKAVRSPVLTIAPPGVVHWDSTSQDRLTGPGGTPLNQGHDVSNLENHLSTTRPTTRPTTDSTDLEAPVAWGIDYPSWTPDEILPGLFMGGTHDDRTVADPMPCTGWAAATSSTRSSPCTRGRSPWTGRSRSCATGSATAPCTAPICTG